MRHLHSAATLAAWLLLQCLSLGADDDAVVFAVDQQKKSYRQIASRDGKQLEQSEHLASFLGRALFHEKLRRNAKSHNRAIVFLGKRKQICWVRDGRFERGDGRKYELILLQGKKAKFKLVE